jgi:hypothetical protein
MLYTASQGLPYPGSRREAANAPLASELLARAVDKKLDALNTAWVAELNASTVVLNLAANITAIPQNSDWPIFMDTITKRVPATTPTGGQTVSASGGDGWYHCFFDVQLSCEGTINASTKRELKIEIAGSGDPLNPNLITERYYRRDYERNGSTNLHIEIVTFLRTSYSVTAYVNHANSSSTVRVDTTNTSISWTKICGEV